MDQSSIPDDALEKEHIDEVFKESLVFFECASLLLTHSDNS